MTASGSSLAEARRDLYRTRILAAAELEFAAGGYERARMTSIAARAELSLATVYKHATAKSEIWDDLHAERMTAMLAQVEQATGSSERIVDRLVSGVLEVARFLTEHGAYLEMNLTVGSGWAEGAEEAQGTQRTVWTAGQQMLTGAVDAAVLRGEIPDQRPRIVTGLVVSALQVWLAEWVASGRDRAADDVLAELEGYLRRMLRAD